MLPVHGVHTDEPNTLYVPAGQSIIDSTTLTVAVSLLFPSVVVAVIVTVPGLMPVTTPFSSTVAIVGSLLVHVTVFTVASLGVIVAVKTIASPTSISLFLGVTSIGDCP